MDNFFFNFLKNHPGGETHFFFCGLFIVSLLLLCMSSEEVEKEVDSLFASEEEEDSKAPMATTRINRKKNSRNKG